MTQQTTIALIGNPNSGKTTIFNALTGSNQKVGNWAGVTIEKKEGHFKGLNSDYALVDLPGLYSTLPHSPEEKIAADYLLSNTSALLINVVDSGNLERHLFLTLQLLALGLPVIVVLNMMDECKHKGLSIDVEALSEQLETPVIPVSAINGLGIDSLLEVIETTLHEIQPNPTEPPVNTSAFSLADEDIIELYQRIDQILTHAVTKRSSSSASLSQWLDLVLTNRWLGVPLFLLLMYGVFSLTFGLGGFFLEGIDSLFSELIAPSVLSALTMLGVAHWMISLIVDGLIGGIGGVLTFLPNILLLFFSIAILEDTGYMARVAFITDRLMRQMGLNGKAIVPMVMGFGCNAPAIMSTRILENPNDRMIAILINPFMSCGARLPIYVLLSSAFFKGFESAVTFSLYVMGLVLAILTALLFKRTLFVSEATPFMMELPPYRLPIASNVWKKVRQHAVAYLYRAGTLIFMASLIIWCLLYIGPNGYGDLTNSFGRHIGQSLAPMLSTAGFGSWQAGLCLLTGIVAKEIVISNMLIIFGLSSTAGQPIIEPLASLFTPLSAYAFMVFSLLYTPCIAVIGIIKSETGTWRWPLFSVLYNLLVAWVASTLVFQIGSQWI